MLSVLMPARNAAWTVHGAVVSTLRAMPRDSELVVLDDASSDHTSSIVEGIGDKRLRLFSSSMRLGVGKSLNRLLQVTESMYVARIDADDLSLPWRFRCTLPAVARNGGIIFSEAVYAGEGRGVASILASRPLSCRAFPYMLLVANKAVHSTMLGMREPIARAGGYRSLPAEDAELWMRLAIGRCSQSRLAVPTVVHRVHPRQLTAESDWEFRSALNPVQNETHGELSLMLLGRRYRRLKTIAYDPDTSAAEAQTEIREFADAFAAGIACLHRVERRRLTRMLTDRIRLAHAVRGLDQSVRPGDPAAPR